MDPHGSGQENPAVTVEEKARIAEAVQKAGVTVVAVLVIGGLFATYLYLQIEQNLINNAREDRNQDRMFALFTKSEETRIKQAERFIEAMETQGAALRELADISQKQISSLQRLKETQQQSHEVFKRETGRLIKELKEMEIRETNKLIREFKEKESKK